MSASVVRSRLFPAISGLLLLAASPAAAANDPTKIVGPNACAECHKLETEVWKGTHHFSTFRDLPRNKKAQEIAGKMGMRRIKAESLCLTCHFTSQTAKGRTEAVAGISCESCHSAGADWVKVHSSYSGKKKETESAAEARERWARAEAAGMIRPHNMYALAKNCYSCHVVPQEKLVNTGGHPAGSAFNLVAWSQGEIRHNLWHSGGKENRPADAGRKRIMFVVGTAVELETALRAVGKATERKAYAVAMARRAAVARAIMGKIAGALGSVPEAAQIVAAGNAAGLKLNNDAELSAAADKVAAATRQLAAKYDGSTFGAVDPMLPAADTYKGKPAR
jgi:hypothetical protein